MIAGTASSSQRRFLFCAGAARPLSCGEDRRAYVRARQRDRRDASLRRHRIRTWSVTCAERMRGSMGYPHPRNTHSRAWDSYPLPIRGTRLAPPRAFFRRRLRPRLKGVKGLTRKTVTVLFADVVGSTRAGRAPRPRAAAALMLRYFDEMRAVIERHGGHGREVHRRRGYGRLRRPARPRRRRAARGARGGRDARGARRAATASSLDAASARDADRHQHRARSSPATARAPSSRATRSTSRRGSSSAAEVGEILIGDATYQPRPRRRRRRAARRARRQGKSVPWRRGSSPRSIRVCPATRGESTRRSSGGRSSWGYSGRRSTAGPRSGRATCSRLLGAAGVGKSRLVARNARRLRRACHRPHGALPPLRRWHHVLAAARDRPHAARSARARRRR